MYAILRDPALYEFTDDKEPASEAALRARLRRLESRQSPDGTQRWLNWAIRSAAGVVVGYVQATVRPGGEAEIAYVVGRQYWRQGHAYAACTAMLAELAAAHKVRRVTATIDLHNVASLALVRKLGLGLIAEDPKSREVTYGRDLY